MIKLKQLTLILVSIAISAGVTVKENQEDLSTFEYKVLSLPSAEHKIAIDHCVSIVQKTWASNIPVKVLFEFNGSNFQKNVVGMAMPKGSIEMNGYKYPSALGKRMFSDLVELKAAIAKKNQYPILSQ